MDAIADGGQAPRSGGSGGGKADAKSRNIAAMYDAPQTVSLGDLFSSSAGSPASYGRSVSKLSAKLSCHNNPSLKQTQHQVARHRGDVPCPKDGVARRPVRIVCRQPSVIRHVCLGLVDFCHKILRQWYAAPLGDLFASSASSAVMYVRSIFNF